MTLLRRIRHHIDEKGLICLFALGFLLVGCQNPSASPPEITETPSSKDQQISGLENTNESNSSETSDQPASNISGKVNETSEVSQKEIHPLDGITLTEGQLLQNDHLTNKTLYLQTLDPSVSYLYPTVSQYRYDLDNQKLELIHTRDPQSNQRVWDFFEKDGHLYESLVTATDDGYCAYITVDGNKIWEGTIIDASITPFFGTNDGIVTFFAWTLEGDSSVETLYQIDSNLEVVPIWSSKTSESNEHMITNSKLHDDYSIPAFTTQGNNGINVYYYRDGKLTSVPYDSVASVVIPIQDGIILGRRNQADIKNFVYDFLDFRDGSISPLKNENGDLGQKNLGAAFDDRLFYVDFDANTNIATVENGELEIQKISNLPSGISNYYRIDDQNVLIYIDAYTSDENQIVHYPHYYIVHL